MVTQRFVRAHSTGNVVAIEAARQPWARAEECHAASHQGEKY